MSRMSRDVVLAFALLFFGSLALAQSYPTKPVKVVVPAASGGMMEMMARALAQRLQEAFGQPFVIDNHPGANGIIGTDLVAKAVPDGYTLLYTPAHAFTNHPFLYAKLPYDAVRDFAPIAMCCVMAQAIVVHPSLKVETLGDLVSLAKSHPGKFAYASMGAASNSDILMQSLKRLAGIDVMHVPYKGSSPAVTDLIGGRVSMMVVTLGVIQGHLRTGKLKALAIGSKRRSTVAPDVPTAAEAGFSGWNTDVWMGLFAPAATPREAVGRLNAEITRITASQQFSEQWFKRNGLEPPQFGSAEQFAEFVRADMQSSEQMIRTLDIKLEY